MASLRTSVTRHVKSIAAEVLASLRGPSSNSCAFPARAIRDAFRYGLNRREAFSFIPGSTVVWPSTNNPGGTLLTCTIEIGRKNWPLRRATPCGNTCIRAMTFIETAS